MKRGQKIKLFRHQVLITSILVIALVVSVFGSSYALFTSGTSSDEYNALQVGNIELSYVDTGSGYGDILSLNGAYPMPNSDWNNVTPYRFYVKNTGSMPVDFKIKLKQDEAIIEADNCGSNLLPLEYVMVKVDANDPVKLGDLLSTDYTIYEGSNLSIGIEDIHEIRIWLSTEAKNDAIGKHFHGKLVIDMIQAGVDSRYIKEYSIGDSVRLIDGSYWHVIEPSKINNTTVTLLSDYNLNSDGTYCTNGACSTFAFDNIKTNEDSTTEPSRLTENNSYCTDQNNGCNMYQKNNSTVIYDSTIKTWVETTYRSKIENDLTTNSGTLDDLYVTIPTMEQIAKADYQNFTQNVVTISNNTFLSSSNYWTKSAYKNNTSSVWYVKAATNDEAGKNDLIYANNSTTVGIRPVITVSKLNVVAE